MPGSTADPSSADSAASLPAGDSAGVAGAEAGAEKLNPALGAEVVAAGLLGAAGVFCG